MSLGNLAHVQLPWDFRLKQEYIEHLFDSDSCNLFLFQHSLQLLIGTIPLSQVFGVTVLHTLPQSKALYVCQCRLVLK